MKSSDKERSSCRNAYVIDEKSFFTENIGVKDKRLFEGDMILTDAQRMAAALGEDVSKAGLGRASIRKNLWPGAVLVYELDSAISRWRCLSNLLFIVRKISVLS